MDNRQRAIYVSRVRVGIGLAMLGVPRVSGRVLAGRGADSPAAATVTRMLGGREVALGAGAAIALAERDTGHNWLSMTALVDGIDAAALLLTPRLPLRARVAGVVAAALAVAQLAVAKELAEAAGVGVDQA
ncbi:MAG: hypothetical protein ACKO2C_09940 [Actinomycetes bacterium]